MTADQLFDRLKRALWEANTTDLRSLHASTLRVLRIGYAVSRDLAAGQLTLRAMSLVYTTLLSLVPLLAVSFSVLKAFGVHNQLEPLLAHVLEPLGPQGGEINARIIEFVSNVKVGVLGSVGFALLFFTVVSLIQKIERAFNYTWRVERHRPFAQRFSGYLSVILIGPVLVFAALGITSSVMSNTLVQQLAAIQPLGSLLRLAARLVPYLLIITAFTFIYLAVPNTRVRLASALAGALIGGLLWQTSGWAFAAFVAGSSRYAAIYSGFAIVIVFMIWLYLGWMILLVGASVAFYHQHPEHLRALKGNLAPSNRVKEKLGMLVMFYVGRQHQQGAPAWTAPRLAERLGVPLEPLGAVLQALEAAGLLTQTAASPPAYVPARALDTVSVTAVLAAVRAHGEGPQLALAQLPQADAVERVLECVDAAVEKALAPISVKALVLSSEGDTDPLQNAHRAQHGD